MAESKKRKRKSAEKETIDLSQQKRRRKRPARSNGSDVRRPRKRVVEKAATSSGAGSAAKSKKAAAKKRAAEKIEAKQGMSMWVKVLIIVVALFAVAGVTYAAQQYFFGTSEGTQVVEEEEPEVVMDERGFERKTDGVFVDSADEANKFPVAVMIENLSTVRPQSGLKEANIVYETLAEGGITRFMAVYSGDGAAEIKPVRSARPYYLEWVSEYDALYAHAGGSPQALAAIDGLGLNDLDALTGDGKYYWRGPGSAPHNLYTKDELLQFALRDKGLLEEEPTFDPWKFKDDEPFDSLPLEEKTINVDFSRGVYNVRYAFDSENNCYMRFHADTPHVDSESGDQHCAKNVVVQVIPPAESLAEKARINLDVTGEGRAVVFRDGEGVEGMWKKDDRLSRTIFVDDSGEEIELNRGQIWVEVIPEDRNFEFN